MPRLGHSDSYESPRRPAAAAYSANAAAGRFNFGNLVMLLALTFILRNLFFHDYRTDEINTLKAAGKSQEEINKYIAQKPEERRQELRKSAAQQKAEYEQLKSDVADLKVQVAALQGYLKDTGVVRNSMDRLSGKTGADTEAEVEEERRVEVQEEDAEELEEEENPVVPEVGRREMEVAQDTRPDAVDEPDEVETAGSNEVVAAADRKNKGELEAYRQIEAVVGDMKHLHSATAGLRKSKVKKTTSEGALPPPRNTAGAKMKAAGSGAATTTKKTTTKKTLRTTGGVKTARKSTTLAGTTTSRTAVKKTTPVLE